MIDGRDAGDVINGGDGNDYLYGGLGNDTINGGAGNDTLIGSYGNNDADGRRRPRHFRGASGYIHDDQGLRSDRRPNLGVGRYAEHNRRPRLAADVEYDQNTGFLSVDDTVIAFLEGSPDNLTIEHVVHINPDIFVT